MGYFITLCDLHEVDYTHVFYSDIMDLFNNPVGLQVLARTLRVSMLCILLFFN
jgi:hypothetical protein